ncbi:unnamed protein product [Schistosoma turkestanicum]|nr:unnamed protein product [Schistosoma turkestanicum]
MDNITNEHDDVDDMTIVTSPTTTMNNYTTEINDDTTNNLDSTNHTNHEINDQNAKFEDADSHKTLMHILRCKYCNFESILRTRFDKHLPCSQQFQTYQLYTCSICLTSSTSKSMMDEHRRVHHSNCCHKVSL